MHREIKFRAWHKKEKWLDSAWLIDLEHEKVCHSRHNQSELEDCVLMQYTGLKDRNGKEIYESDIWKEGQSIGIIRYVMGGFEIEWITNPEYFTTSLRYHFEHGEVAGNEFEQPHLLKGEEE